MEKKGKLVLEEKIAVVDEWIYLLTEIGEVGDLDKEVLRATFEEYGANFAISEDLRRNFRNDKYSNKQRTSAVKAVWGEKYASFRRFSEDFVDDYEQRTGKKLPKIVFKKTGNIDKTSGMRQFFQQLTAYAATSEDEFSIEDLRLRIVAQAKNGRLREKGITKKEEREHIVIDNYNEGKPFAPAGFPQEFPKAAWEYIKSFK